MTRRALQKSLYRLGTDDGKGSGRLQARRAAHKERQSAGAKRGEKGKKKKEKHDKIVAYYMMLNGGQLPEVARYGTIQETARTFEHSSGHVGRLIKKAKKTST